MAKKKSQPLNENKAERIVFSGKEVENAGRLIKKPNIHQDQEAFLHAMNVLFYWRNLHLVPMQNAFELLEKIAQKHDKKAFIAKRPKRHFSIMRKLKLEQKMNLRNMQDVAGCRAIFTTQKKLDKSFNELKKYDVFKKPDGGLRGVNYIATPKDSGYRSIHMIGKFSDNNQKRKSVEIQLRTRMQHYWATALEIIDIFTNQALKSNMGNADWAYIFKQISFQFVIMEKIHLFDSLATIEQYKKYRDIVINERHGEEAISVIQSIYDIARLESKLKIIEQLNAFAGSIEVMDSKIKQDELEGYALLIIDPKKGEIMSNIFGFDRIREASEEYLSMEKKYADSPNIVVSMVATNSIGGIPEAYPNFFADSTKFLTNLAHIINLQKELNPSWLKRMFDSMNLKTLSE